MTSQKKRYLLIGLFFLVLTIVSLISMIKAGFSKSHLTYTIICAAISLLFIKNVIVS